MNASVPVPSDVRDRRAHPRFTVARRARLLHGPSGLSSAMILDISASGAKVKLDKPEGVADTLIIVDMTEGVAFESVVMWRKPPEIGLRFTRRHNLKGLVPAHLRIAKALWQHEGDAPPPPPVVPLMPRLSPEEAEAAAAPVEPSESRKANAALTQSWRARLVAGGLEPN